MGLGTRTSGHVELVWERDSWEKGQAGLYVSPSCWSKLLTTVVAELVYSVLTEAPVAAVNALIQKILRWQTLKPNLNYV